MPVRLDSITLNGLEQNLSPANVCHPSVLTFGSPYDIKLLVKTTSIHSQLNSHDKPKSNTLEYQAFTGLKLRLLLHTI